MIVFPIQSTYFKSLEGKTAQHVRWSLGSCTFMRCQFKTSRSTHTPPDQRTSFAQTVRPNASAAGFTGNELVMLHAVYAGGVNSTTNTGYIRSPWSGVIPLSPLNRSIPAFHWPCPGNVVITTGMVKNADKGRTWNRWWYPPYGQKLVVPPSPQGILCFTFPTFTWTCYIKRPKKWFSSTNEYT